MSLRKAADKLNNLNKQPSQESRVESKWLTRGPSAAFFWTLTNVHRKSM